MLFWKKPETKTKATKASLQANQAYTPLFMCADDLNPYEKDVNISKRVSCFTSPQLKASMSLEAALSFSLFLFFLVNVFSLIFLFIRYGDRLEALQQQGKELAIYAYSAESLLEGNDDLIRLYDTETVESLFTPLAAPKGVLPVQCVVKPWTGYSVTDESSHTKEEQVVYVTDNGRVYHKSRSCTHLSLSIRIVSFDRVNDERNDGGERYTPCEFCGNHSFLTVAFLTGQGNRYHSTLNCKGLKRTVREVYLSEAGSMPACSKCG